MVFEANFESINPMHLKRVFSFTHGITNIRIMILVFSSQSLPTFFWEVGVFTGSLKEVHRSDPPGEAEMPALPPGSAADGWCE